MGEVREGGEEAVDAEGGLFDFDGIEALGVGRFFADGFEEDVG